MSERPLVARPWRRARGASSCLRAGALLLGLACGEDAGPEPAPLPPPFPEPIPVPGCEAFDYFRCDVRLPECVENLAQIASCMRGGAAPESSPSVTFLSQEEARQDLLEALSAAPPPSPNHFERALVLLGLTQPSSFEPDVTAERLAAGYTAYYRRDSDELVVIDHGGRIGVTAGTPATQALVLHELIHALQDREHDLDAFAVAHQQDSEGNLRGNCLIEGEARLHELRLYSALWGNDVNAVDWTDELRTRSNEAEDEVFLATDLYAASQLSVPYTFGAAYVEQVRTEQGPDGVRALFDAPPANVREILALGWGGAATLPAAPPLAPLAPEGLTREAYSSLGAWGIYLMTRPRSPTLEVARQLALSWSSDLLEAFSFDGGQTALSWTIELATEADAASLASLLAPVLQAQQSGTRLRLLLANGAVPPALLTAAGVPMP